MKNVLTVATVLVLGSGLSESVFAKKQSTATEKTPTKRKVAQTGASELTFNVKFKKTEKSALFFKEIGKKISMASKYDEGFGPFDGGCSESSVKQQNVYLCQIQMVEPGGTRYLVYVMNDQKSSSNVELNDLFPVPMSGDEEP